MPSGSIHVAANGKISFFFMAEQYFIVYVYVSSLSINLLMNIKVASMSWLLSVVLLLKLGGRVSFSISVFVFVLDL